MPTKMQTRELVEAQQEEYNRKLDDISTEKIYKMAQEQEVPKFTADNLVLAQTDTSYDKFEKQQKLSSITTPKKSKQKNEMGEKVEDEDEDEDENKKKNNKERDDRIIAAIATVVGLSFVFGGEEGVSEETVSTVMALALFFVVVHAITRESPKGEQEAQGSEPDPKT